MQIERTVDVINFAAQYEKIYNIIGLEHHDMMNTRVFAVQVERVMS